MKNILIGCWLLLASAGCTERREAENATLAIARGKMPAVTNDANKTIHLVYGSGDKLMYTSSNDEGQTFTSPELVANLAGLVASATRGPQIAATKNGIAIIAVNKDGDIFSYIKDGWGKWNEAGRVNDTDTTNKEGFIGLSGDNENNLFAIWTDLRGDHQNKIFGARSTDGGKTWMKNILVYASPAGTVCECCKPSVVMKDRNVFVMFRNWLHGNRDLYLIRSSDGGESFEQAQKLGERNWALDGCPMDGGGMAVDQSGNLHTVWRRENKIYACEPGKAESEIGEGKNCTIGAVGDQSVYSWIESGKIVCLLPGNKKISEGYGSLSLLQSVNENTVLCIWQNDDEIYRQVIHL